MSHLFVTNDFPPKLGGIQTMLWELWRRLDPGTFTVLTTPHPDAAAWDRDQPYRVRRTRMPVLLPTPGLVRRIGRTAADDDARLVVLDPALPLGLVGPRLSLPYAVVVHGAEVTVPGRLPLTGALLGRVLRGASLVVAAGGYPLAEAERAAGRPLPHVLVPPGVDVDRFRPVPAAGKPQLRRRLGLPPTGPLVVSVSRLVPRKGMDVLIRAAAHLRTRHPDLAVAIGGTGRDHGRLERLVRRSGAPVRLLGRVEHDDLPRLYAAGDVFAMVCRNRWAGLEQEGFGIVFLEAAAAGVPQVAGDSGGAAEAVADGETGIVVDRPRDHLAVAAALERLITHPERAAVMGEAARSRAEAFSYDALARRLGGALAGAEGR